MAETPESYVIRGALNALDDDVYANNLGYPGHAALGTELINNDRDLHAYLRTVPINTAYPDTDAPTEALYWGVHYGPFSVQPTPGNKEGEWYFRLKIDNSAAADAIQIVPYVLGTHPFRGRGFAGALGATVDGDGTDTTFGPYTTPLPHAAGLVEVGFVLVSEITTVSAVLGDLSGTPGTTSITAVAADVFGAVSTPSKRVVRLLEASGGSDRALTGWHDILSVTTNVNANDTASIWPPLDGRLADSGGMQYEMRQIWGCEVKSFTLREKPLATPLL